MIRVAFVFQSFLGSGQWLGGTNYFRNLLAALRSNQSAGISPVAFFPIRAKVPPGFLVDDIVQSPLVDAQRLAERAGIWQRLGQNWLLERFLRHHQISVLSHSGHLGPRATTPTATWIPDLQYKRLPRFFPDAERRERDAWLDDQVHVATRIIVSSQNALDDLCSFFPSCTRKARILRFVDVSTQGAPATSAETLARRYDFAGPYFLVANQFWAHKNHGLIVRALKLLKAAGQRVLVLCTGRTTDHRDPGYFDRLMGLRAEAGVERDFRVLGPVSYADLVGLMRGSIAMINPSLFEGWATCVEEAKSLGKKILLSNIGVHLEQAPRRAVFFDPADAGALSKAMRRTLEEHDQAEELGAKHLATAELPGRAASFAEAFADIVRDCL